MVLLASAARWRTRCRRRGPTTRRAPRVARCAAASLFQERLWILQQLEPRAPPPAGPGWPVRGEVPREQLLAAVQRVHARHLGLRVHFVQEDGVPGARRVTVPPVTVHDLRHLPAGERLAAVQAARERAVHTPIDLSRQTPLRFELLDFAPDGYGLIVAAHHIAVDAWSLQILLRELARGCSRRRPSRTTARARLQYADYAAWQREHQRPRRQPRRPRLVGRRAQGGAPTSMFPPDLPASGAPRAAPRWTSSSTPPSAPRSNAGAGAPRHRLHGFPGRRRRRAARFTGGRRLIGSPMGVRERAEFEDFLAPS